MSTYWNNSEISSHIKLPNLYNIINNSIIGLNEGIDADSLSSVVLTLPDSYNGNLITSIADNAFKNLSNNIFYFDISSLISIGDQAFQNCKISSAFASNLKNIGASAFLSCETISDNINFQSVSSIGNSAFYDCINLSSFDLSNAKEIGEASFENCDLSSLNLNSLTSLGDNAFSGNKKIRQLLWVKKDDAYQEISDICPDSISYLTSLTAAVSSVLDFQISACTNLQILTLSSQASLIDDFNFPDSLTSIEVTDDNLKYSIIDNIVYSKDFSILYTALKTYSLSSFEPNSNCKKIESKAMLSCSKISAVTLNHELSVYNDSFDFSKISSYNLDYLVKIISADSMNNLADSFISVSEKSLINVTNFDYPESKANDVILSFNNEIRPLTIPFYINNKIYSNWYSFYTSQPEGTVHPIHVINNNDNYGTYTVNGTVYFLDSLNSKFYEEENIKSYYVNLSDDIYLKINGLSAKSSSSLSGQAVTDSLLMRENISLYDNNLDVTLSSKNLNTYIEGYADISIFRDYVYLLYYKLLSNMVNMQYCNKSSLIWPNLSNQILVSYTENNNNLDEIVSYKVKNRIPLKFNEVQIVNDIQEGKDFLTNYNDVEQHVLGLEISRRARSLDDSNVLSDNLLTRYYYYREAKVKEYFKFIEYEYNISLSNIYLSSDIYEFDKNYISSDVNYIRLLNIPENDSQNYVTINDSMLSAVSEILTEITLSISDIREQIRSQVQKNYMKGTFLLLSYIINEFLKNNTYKSIKNILDISSYSSLSSAENKTELIEYLDPTEYFNLRADLAAENNNAFNTVDDFWKTAESNRIVAGNDNKLFQNPKMLKLTTEGVLGTLSDFYCGIMKMKYDNEKLQNFLSTVFNTGATASHSINNVLNLYTPVDSIYDGSVPLSDSLNLMISSVLSDKLSEIALSCFTGALITDNKWNGLSSLSSLSIDISDYYKLNSSSLFGLSPSANSYLKNELLEVCSLNLSDVLSLDEASIKTLSNASFSQISSLPTSAEISDIVSAGSIGMNQVLTIELSDLKSYYENTIYNVLSSAFNSSLSDKEIFLTNLYDYKKELYYKYSGISNIGQTPWYYLNNVYHSSYQIHPFLSSFVEYIDYLYPIANTYNSITEMSKYYLSDEIDNNIGKYGNFINLWKNKFAVNSDYMSKYELGSHTAPNNSESPQIGYDGAFYPPALDEFLKLNNVNEIPSQMSAYLSCLNLTDEELQHIYNQMAVFMPDINRIAKGDYDIYKFAIDMYGNSYMLYKNYRVLSASEEEKQNCPGELWIKFRNHPLAFPAWSLGTDTSYQQIAHASITTNEKVMQISKSFMHDIPIIYDMTEDSARQVFLMNGYIDSGNFGSVNLSGCTYYEKSSSLVMTALQNWNTESNYYFRILTKDTKTNKDFIKRPDFINSKNSFKFIGYTKYNNYLAAVYYRYLSETQIEIYVNYYVPGDTDDNFITKIITIPDTYSINDNYGIKIATGSENNLTLAYLHDIESTDIVNYCEYGKEIPADNLNLSGVGKIYNYPENKILNDENSSFDYNDKYIVTLDLTLYAATMTVNNFKKYNLNADMGYIPLYANSPIRLWNNAQYKNKDYWKIELLGLKSSEHILKNSNDSRYNGRVWENWNLSDFYYSFYNKKINNASTIVSAYSLSNDLTSYVFYNMISGDSDSYGFSYILSNNNNKLNLDILTYSGNNFYELEKDKISANVSADNSSPLSAVKVTLISSGTPNLSNEIFQINRNDYSITYLSNGRGKSQSSSPSSVLSINFSSILSSTKYSGTELSLAVYDSSLKIKDKYILTAKIGKNLNAETSSINYSNEEDEFSGIVLKTINGFDGPTVTQSNHINGILGVDIKDSDIILSIAENSVIPAGRFYAEFTSIVSTISGFENYHLMQLSTLTSEDISDIPLSTLELSNNAYLSTAEVLPFKYDESDLTASSNGYPKKVTNEIAVDQSFDKNSLFIFELNDPVNTLSSIFIDANKEDVFSEYSYQDRYKFGQDITMLSVSYYYDNNLSGIVLEFNSSANSVNNSRKITEFGNDYDFSLKLNPDSAGQLAVYGNIIDGNGISFLEKLDKIRLTYWIKNISDDKPKFIIYANVKIPETIEMNTESIKNGTLSDSVFVLETSTKNKNTGNNVYTPIAYDQYMVDTQTDIVKVLTPDGSKLSEIDPYFINK